MVEVEKSSRNNTVAVGVSTASEIRDESSMQETVDRS